ncbi:response regulator [Marinobacter nanhaiticus D15-8W]|uniref:Response regulator n=1 Tax=Marinobacter nanhaiticus D15-8W TaxID=626887 RepID=N6X0C8_9GAMM|nr:tetratricopeptide repeat-containing response regulator [Marinobacter nanhaiticus]ENO14508.1 response regulator [Marinobacter nanhaiticus D15-8W]BES71902.1 response regulator [Marinobacter nanhaiticus D15-8W]
MSAVAAPKSPSEIDFSKLRVVVVDDFENFRLSMRQMLRGMGVGHIDTSASGTAAVQNCAYEHYDIVLCDYNLGSGKNGQHVLEELRHRKLLRRTSLFIMVTAETSKEMVMGAREYLPDAYLTKPINQAALSQRLNALLHQRAVLYPINREIDLENLPKAISLCTQLLPQQPRYRTWILKTLSDLYFQIGDYSHARKICEDVLQSRDIAWARLGLGKVLIAEQRHEEAIVALQTLIEKQPDLVEAYDLLAQALAATGKPTAAQQTLEKATTLSPNAILRQRQLATMAAENQDLDTASAAWRRTVHLGVHSIHDAPEHYLNLGRSLSELSEDDRSQEGQAQADEALRILQALKKRFPEAPEAYRQGLMIQARVHADQGRGKEAGQIVDEVLASEDGGDMSPDTVLELARTLFAMERREEAEKQLFDLSQRCADDSRIQAAIEALLDEPVGFRKRVKARQLNRNGIKAFENGDLDAAAEIFREALSLVPKHAALNLNLVQVRLKQLETQPRNTFLLEECRACLEKLRDLSQQHQQYRRFQSLQRKVESLS